jgi:hypothetical protein
VKSLIAAIGVVAVAHLLALAGVGGWLYSTGRLSPERVETVRDLFQEPVAIVQARMEREEAQAEAEAASLAEQMGPPGPPVSAAESLALRLEVSELDTQRIERLRREVQDLQRSLRAERRLLEQERAGFDQERTRFEQMRERLKEIEGGEQFRKALASMEGMKADDARLTLQALLDDGDMEQAVSYLNAMQDRTRTKIIAAFVGNEQPELAAELLEALRVRGLEAAAQ